MAINERPTVPINGPIAAGGLPVFEVNFLYLVTMGLVVILGSLMQAGSPFFGLILTEIFLILTPALLYLRWRKLLSFESLRLEWPGLWTAIANIIAGLGLSFFAAWLTGVLFIAFGYSTAYGAASAPKDLPQAYLALLGLTLFAPICEEILFRGVLLRGYEPHGTWWSAGIVAVLFAAYHLSFLRFFAILPVALALGWTASRSRSTVSSILLHFGYNVTGAVWLMIGVLNPSYHSSWYGSLPTALVGLLLAASALILIDRIARVRTAAGGKAATGLEVISGLFNWNKNWPLGVGLLVALGMAVVEVVLARSPELLISQRLALTPSGWDTPVSWSYELRNAGDQVIGQADCTRSSQKTSIRLTCKVHQNAYKYQNGSSYFQDTTFDRQLTVDWDPISLNLVHLESRTSGEQINNTIQAELGDGGLTLNVKSGGLDQIPLALSQDVLYQDEWPWRLMALPFADGYGGKTSLAYPMLYNSRLNRNVPTQVDAVAMIYLREPVTVPAGQFYTWKLILDKSTAWYDTAEPHNLIKYTDGMTTYLLTGKK